MSEATVSRVVNNRGVVAPGTRKTVEDAMRQLGYSRASSSNVVLLVTPHLIDPFFAALADRISAALSSHDVRAVICSAPGGAVQEFDFISALVDLGAIGVVFISASNTLENADPVVPRFLETRKIPFLCINGSFREVPSATLSTDDELAAEVAVAHLWNLGHRDIALIAGPVGNRPSDRRVSGYRKALRLRGQDGAETKVIHHEYSVEGGYAAASEMFADRAPTAVVAASDEIAFGTIRAAKRRGLLVPEDLSVVGYDDAHPLEFTDPPLTTVRQPIERLAQAVVPILTRLIAGRPVQKLELLFEPELVQRASTSAILRHS
ncbi:LacI family DNA-binding transcriptional regulator [Frondihabitans sp. PAMC 28766]|uniref:LacI family DNA-binding transcriptional regulator n=1 Tax=Frondihabitans sp. PAMC 28766 TaxID=1795630 RepID=UPI00194F458A|nr:LacI family DNA-binding transcriptional regulator [Frondihabitans sp. PAMC 28766]